MDSVTQTHRKKKRKVVNEDGDLETIWETESESEYGEDELRQLERERKLAGVAAATSPKGLATKKDPLRKSGGKGKDKGNDAGNGIFAPVAAVGEAGAGESKSEREKRKKEESENLKKAIDERANPLEERLGK